MNPSGILVGGFPQKGAVGMSQSDTASACYAAGGTVAQPANSMDISDIQAAISAAGVSGSNPYFWAFWNGGTAGYNGDAK